MSGENRFFNSISGVLLTIVCIGRPFRTIVNSLFSNAAGVTTSIAAGCFNLGISCCCCCCVRLRTNAGVATSNAAGVEEIGAEMSTFRAAIVDNCFSSSSTRPERCSIVLNKLIMSACVGGDV